MAQVHDKFVIELAEVIKGYGNDPDIDDPFHLSEFYRFYELPEIAVSANHFRTMIPLELEIAKAIEHLPSAQPEISRIEQELHGKTPEEQYEFLYWLLLKFGLAYTDSKLAVVEWLRGEKEDG